MWILFSGSVEEAISHLIDPFLLIKNNEKMDRKRTKKMGRKKKYVNLKKNMFCEKYAPDLA